MGAGYASSRARVLSFHTNRQPGQGQLAVITLAKGISLKRCIVTMLRIPFWVLLALISSRYSRLTRGFSFHYGEHGYDHR